MYIDYYGLKEKPFNLTPDPRFLYLTPGYREALSQLLYGVQERRGFMALTGEVGTGKTTLLQALLAHLDEETTKVAYIFNSTLPFDGLVEYMLEDLGVDRPAGTPAQRIFVLNRFLIERCRAGQNSVLIIDEAQNLSPETLEQVRLLSNFESRTDKLLQILLVGQPELRNSLSLPQLRQLNQRISLRCTIHPLDPSECGEYVRHRLSMAGAGSRSADLFPAAALDRIARYSAGIPRMINIVCDHCLLFGYADQRPSLDVDVVEEVIRQLDQTEPASATG
ncbi:MAG: ExeA family protein [Candidatus Binatia bacterium]